MLRPSKAVRITRELSGTTESNTQHGKTGGQRKMLLTCNLSLSYAKLPLKQLSVQACHDLFENIDASCQEWKLSFKPIKWKNYIHYVFTSLQCIFCNCQFNQTATSSTDCKMMYAPVFGKDFLLWNIWFTPELVTEKRLICFCPLNYSTREGVSNVTQL